MADFSILAKVKLDIPGSKLEEQLANASAGINEGSLTFQAANMIFSKTVEIMGAMVEQVYELDDALTEFEKVSDLSGVALEQYTEQLGELGEQVGRTTANMVEAASNFRKAGFNDQDSAQLALVAAKLQNVADNELSAADATNFLVSQMTAFGFSAENAEYIIDAVNEVSNNFAVSSTDLTKTLPLVSAALAVGNNEFEEMIGLMTGAVEITRNSSRAARGNIVSKCMATCTFCICLNPVIPKAL